MARRKGGGKSGPKGASVTGPGGGARQMHVRLKDARRHTASSQRWLQRQLNDPYVAAAKREGFRSRAAYKLAEIDDKHRLLKPGMRVVDLGAAPGGWSQIAAERVAAVPGQGQVVAIDLDPSMRARVTLDVDRKLQLPTDTSAGIRTSGLLGDQYIALAPGAEEAPLKSGDEITMTESALSIERLIGRFVHDSGVEEKK